MHLESLRITDGGNRERALCLRAEALFALERTLQVNHLGTDFFHAGVKTQGAAEGLERRDWILLQLIRLAHDRSG